MKKNYFGQETTSKTAFFGYFAGMDLAGHLTVLLIKKLNN